MYQQTLLVAEEIFQFDQMSLFPARQILTGTEAVEGITFHSETSFLVTDTEILRPRVVAFQMPMAEILAGKDTVGTVTDSTIVDTVNQPEILEIIGIELLSIHLDQQI
jgi:hypothetical protein